MWTVNKIFTKQKFFLAYLPILIIVGLVFKQPNLSMVLLLMSTAVAMFFCAGGSWRFLVATCTHAILFVFLYSMVYILQKY